MHAISIREAAITKEDALGTELRIINSQVDRLYSSIGQLMCNRLSPNNRPLIAGCINELISRDFDSVRSELAQTDDLLWYRYVSRNIHLVREYECLRGIKAKLLSKVFVPRHILRFDNIRQIANSNVVFYSYCDSKPYKAAFCLNKGLAIRLELERRGFLEDYTPEPWSRSHLRSVYMTQCTPSEFSSRLRAYSRVGQLSSIQELALEVIDNLAA